MRKPPLWIRLCLIAAVLSAVGVMIGVEEVRSSDAIGQWIAAVGMAAPLVYIALHIPASLAFLPRAVMGGAAGLMFGLEWGLVWAQTGAMAGAMAGFLIARAVAQDWVDRPDMQRLKPLLDRTEAGGWRAVMIARLVPVVPHALVNYGIGLTRIRIRDFALGSFIGMVPTTVAFVNLGVSGRSLFDGGWDWLLPAAFGVAVLGASAILSRVLSRRQQVG
ncbi:MAG: TVP38/TMEM64 family protein [Alphaproteobacteria bacterium]|nr:MAG: TVP38/TMEM64 family protein [Alphaproteobacteria bacterium]